MATKTKINAVFEGGGVKGTGLVGAVAATMAAGYEFGNVAGTSAGAIVGCLIAAGYSAADIKQILDSVDYNRFKDTEGIARWPLIGPGISLFVHKGIFAGDYFENWIRGLLAKKGASKFADLINPEFKNDPRLRYRLQVIASDITRGKLLVLPGDAADYSINPDDLDIAAAVRMSMSLPYFYQPVLNTSAGQKCFIVDGGILSNFPVWILDDLSDTQRWPTFGYKLVDPNESRPHRIIGPITFFEAMFNTMLEAHDARYIKDADFMRTIPIPTLGIATTDFNINQAQKDALYNSGLTAAQKFLSEWSFENYRQKLKTMAGASRTQRIKNNKSP